jgi:DNA oxidative demethylase
MPKSKSAALPEGFSYREDFISEDEERYLLESLSRLAFHTFEMHGVRAKRRVAHFGWNYGYESWRLTPGRPVPEFLEPLRAKAADWLGLEPEDLAEVLVTEYQPGAGIGWHRDAPMFDRVVGVSLASPCRFRFRRGKSETLETTEFTPAPRSAYILDGDARRSWQHSIPGTKDLRYSVTFRTLKQRPS